MVPTKARAGFTLIELLVVMGLISILMGITVGVLGRTAQGAKVDIAWRVVRNALADARRTSLDQGALSRVAFVPGPPARIAVRRGREAGSWHFDEAQNGKVLGGRNTWALLRGASIVDGGVIRKCAKFGGGHSVICEPSTQYDPCEGFVLTLEIKPEAEFTGATLASYGSTFTFDIGQDGSLSATLDPDAEQASVVKIQTPPHVVAGDAWARVELSYDGIEVLLRAHGVIEARKKVVSDFTQGYGVRLAKPRDEERLVFGSPPWRGLIDEVSYKTLEASEPGSTESVMTLEPDVELNLKAPVEVRFDGEGRLDPRVHDGIVEIPLSCEGEQRKVVVDLSGVVR